MEKGHPRCLFPPRGHAELQGLEVLSAQCCVHATHFLTWPKKQTNKQKRQKKIEISKYLIFFFIIWQSCIPSPLPNLARSCILNPVHLYLNVVPLPPWEREALSGHGGCYKSGGGGFFVLFCSFKISSQNQRFPNDCINSKQTNKPKTKGVFSTKPTCEASLAWAGQVRVAASPGLQNALGSKSQLQGEIWGAGKGGQGFAGGLRSWRLGCRIGCSAGCFNPLGAGWCWLIHAEVHFWASPPFTAWKRLSCREKSLKEEEAAFHFSSSSFFLDFFYFCSTTVQLCIVFLNLLC